MKNKGISSILGALIFLQILLLSLVLIVSTQNKETSITLKAISRLHELSESSPITEFVDNNKTYIFSLHPLEITHIIYPNGQIKNVSILLTRLPVTSILNGYKWAIIVTSNGAWYNISLLTHDSTYTTTLLFPNYHNWGTPLDPSLLNPSNWRQWYKVLEGVGSPSATSLVYVNYSGYQYALTNAVLTGYMPSTDGWINLTLIPKQKWGYVKNNWHYSFRGNMSIAIAIPINATETVKLKNVYTGYVTYHNLSQLQYIFIPFNIDNKIYRNYWAWYKYWFNETKAYRALSCTYGYDILGKAVANVSAWRDDESVNPVPVTLYYPPAQEFPIDSYYTGDHNKFVAFTLYRFNINIPKGKLILYGYNVLNDSWVKIFDLQYIYDNPNLYPASNNTALHYFAYSPLTIEGYERLYNVLSIQYLTNYPFYVVVPKGTYLVEVDLS